MTTETKFNTSLENVECSSYVHMIEFDQSSLDDYETNVEIMNDYKDEMEYESHQLSRDMEDAVLELNEAKSEAKESKRIAKIRSRITGTGLTDDEFVIWAEGRSVINNDMKLSGVFSREGYLYAWYRHARWGESSVPINRGKVWRVAR